MNALSIEHSKAAIAADFVAYVAACAGLLLLLMLNVEPARAPYYTAVLVAGLITWTAIEYALHRFVLHAIHPFCDWHEEHHMRPGALIGAPTLVSGMLFLLLVYVPAYFALGPWPACAFTLGVLAGYLVYSIHHHAIHRWPSTHGWIRRSQARHTKHHDHEGDHFSQPGPFGVTTVFWDHLIGTYPDEGAVRKMPASRSSRGRYYRI